MDNFLWLPGCVCPPSNEEQTSLKIGRASKGIFQAPFPWRAFEGVYVLLAGRVTYQVWEIDLVDLKVQKTTVQGGPLLN